MPTRLGDFELLVLLTLGDLGTGDEQDTPHGAVIREALEARAARRVSPGAVYNTLDRLERRGCVTSWLGEPTPVRGGKRKRHYRLEAAGRTAIEDTRASLLRLVQHAPPGVERP